MKSCRLGPSLTKDWHFDQRMWGGIGTRCKPTATRNFFATRHNHRMSFSWIDVDSASKLTVEQFITAQLSNVFGVGSRDKGFTPGIHPCPISSHPCCGASEMCYNDGVSLRRDPATAAGTKRVGFIACHGSCMGWEFAQVVRFFVGVIFLHLENNDQKYTKTAKNQTQSV